MKQFIPLIFLISLTGCALKPSHTIFLKERNYTIVNLKGEDCLQSGIQILSTKAPKYQMRYSYKNCEVTVIRDLQEYELKQWGLQPIKE